jgi:pilus assembly protein CpaB
MVPVKDVPKDYVPAAALDSYEKVGGRVAAGFIPAGDIIFDSKLRSKEKLSKPSLIVEKGKRLISLPVTDISSVANLIKIGDRVDLLATFVVNKAEKDADNQWVDRQITTTVIQNVRVFDIINGVPTEAPAAGSEGSSNDKAGEGRLGKGSNATFEVTPQEAEKVQALYAKAPSFTMTLRRYDDEESVKTAGVMETELLKGVVSAPAPPPAPTPAPAPEPVKPAAPKRYY